MLPRLVLAPFFPLFVFFGGARLMLVVAGTDANRAAAREGKPLNQRFGYTRDEVVALWGKLTPENLDIERRLLRIDLAFPFLYGTALAFSLLAMWTILGRPFNPAWLLIPVVLGVVADWTENLVQLGQLQRFMQSGAAAVDASSVALASAATMVKLTALGAGALLLLVLVGATLVRGPGTGR